MSELAQGPKGITLLVTHSRFASASYRIVTHGSFRTDEVLQQRRKMERIRPSAAARCPRVSLLELGNSSFRSKQFPEDR